ncbi:MAG TPA: transglutaminase family protein [Polyangiaceae bacterium]
MNTSDLEPFDFLVRDYARTYPFAYEPLHYFNLAIYFAPEQASAQAPLRRWLAEYFREQPEDTVGWLFALNRTVHQHLEYRPRPEPGIQQALTTLELGTGSCRDYATFLIECARSLGIAARFVSGYLADLTPGASEGRSMHAWAEVFLPGAGWRGLDPTHGIFCDSSYVPIAHAVVAESVNPVHGSFAGEASVVARLTTDVRVRPVCDDPDAAVPIERWPVAG